MSRNIQIKPETLELLGLRENDLTVYVALLGLGSSSLRRIAAEAGLSRGTAYDALKRLKDAGLIGHIDSSKHKYFMAEDPKKLRSLATRREVAVQEARDRIDALLPALSGIAGASQHRPAVRYYEGADGARAILDDVLRVTEKLPSKTYRVYSSSGVRDLIAAAWPRYNTTRKKRGIHVRAIAIGDGGGTHGMDERKWLSRESSAPTYIFMYGKKTAYVGIDDREELFGVIIDDASVSSTQEMIFDALWDALEE